MTERTISRLAAHGLTRMFSPKSGVHDIDLDIAPGEIHALVGLNGAGKTTLMRLLLGMIRPQRGTAVIHGQRVRDVDGSTWARVGHLVDYPLAYGELDTRTNLSVAGRLHGIPRDRVAPAVDRIIAELNLTDYASVRARILSHGNRQRVGLAAALVHDPDVLVLDEPTNALDPAGVILLRESLVRRAANGAGVLVSSHHLDEVARVAHRISVMNGGAIIGSLDPCGVDIERAFFTLVHADDERRAVADRAGERSVA